MSVAIASREFTEDDRECRLLSPRIAGSSASESQRPQALGAGRGGADLYARWIMVFLAVGVAARLIRYLLRFPLWGDEAMLAMNFLDRDYAGLMQPLNFHQVAPLLFLWIELTAVKLLGFHEWSLRLFPLLCSFASLFLFHRLARLLLRGTALVLAVGIFAVTYSGLRYASEMKPYAVDLMVSTLLLLLAVRWWRQPDDTRWLWALAAVVPLALGLSYPAVFVAGGVSLAVAAVLWGTRSRRGWWVWGVYNLALAGSFLAWYRLTIGPQAGAELDLMAAMWSEAFPPRDSLVSLFAWLARVHAGPLLAVPVGGDHWGSVGTTLMCLVAVGVLIRRGRYRLLVLCSAPFALNLIAAAVRRFPYGGHMRLAMHLMPLACILAGIGAAAVLKWLRGVHSPLPLGEGQGVRANLLPSPSGRGAGGEGTRFCRSDCRVADAGSAINGTRFLSAGQRTAGDPQAGFRRVVLEQHGTGPGSGLDQRRSEADLSAAGRLLGKLRLATVSLQPADLLAPACPRPGPRLQPRIAPAPAGVRAILVAPDALRSAGLRSLAGRDEAALRPDCHAALSHASGQR